MYSPGNFVLVRLFSALTVLCVLLASSLAWSQPRDLDLAIEFGGQVRHYLVHVPPQASEGTPLPVIVNLHGGGGSALGHKRRVQMEPLADREGVILVFPDGYQASEAQKRKLLTWNVGNCCGAALRDESDDAGFILAALEHVASRYPVDPKRVYVTGFSNGGMMSYAVARKFSERVAAIAPVSGANDTAIPRGIGHMPVMHIHSMDDPRAWYRGGEGPPFPMSTTRVRHPAVEPVVAAWAAHNGCSKQASVGESLRADNGHSATLVSYVGCPPDGEVLLWRLTGSGHVWPGKSGRSSKNVVGEETNVIDANELIWAFFKRHQRPNAPSLGASPPPSRGQQLEESLDSEVEGSLEVGFDRGKVEASLTGATSRPRDAGTSAKLREGGLGLRLAVPLISRLTVSQRTREGWVVLANLAAGGYMPNSTLIGEPQRFYRFGAGLSASMLTSSMNLYGIHLGARIAESEDTLSAPTYLPLAVGLATYRFILTSRSSTAVASPITQGRAGVYPSWASTGEWRVPGT